MGFGKELLILGLLCMLGKCFSECELGYSSQNNGCVDLDECDDNPDICGTNSECNNTIGSYYCKCRSGFVHSNGKTMFTAIDGSCEDDNECINNPNGSICGPGGVCSNLIGSYKCTCNFGFTNTDGSEKYCTDINECRETEITGEDLCGPKGACRNTDGSYWCKCQKGYTNYGNERTPCSELDCDHFNAESGPAPSLEGLADILLMMRNSCLSLTTPSISGEVKANGEALLEKLFTATESILLPGPLNSSGGVSELLGSVENAIRIIGPQLRHNRTRLETTETVDAEIAVQRGKTRPTGPIHLSTESATLDTDWATAAGTGSYPGFALAALLSYRNLDISFNQSFEGLRGHNKDGTDPVFQVFSRVVSVVVSNPNTESLSHPINLTLRHLQDMEESPRVKYICTYWSESGTWSTDGCYQQHSNATHTVCKCEHLSSFAVLVALYPMEHPFELQLVTKIGLTLSLLCLILCILTFKFCRSIQGTRTTIHLHLCICLFVADLCFLVGVSQTTPVGGCRFVAVMLHLFFMGVFTWMLLEGVQLYRMVVQVFNATIRPLYLYLTGYGIPLVVVIISVSIRPKGYGTDRHCWLSIEDGLIWSFFGPICFIIVLNTFFFIITVWKLAQKFTSLNPDLSNLHKIKAFTVTAIAQMCILGLMWIFGGFLFQKNDAAAYLFTILNSLQGVLVFIMHCLLSKQVRDEYAHFLSCICTPQKKRYSDFSSTNPSSSQSQASRSGQHTGESQI